MTTEEPEHPIPEWPCQECGEYMDHDTEYDILTCAGCEWIWSWDTPMPVGTYRFNMTARRWDG